MNKLEQIKQPISAEFEVFKQKFDNALQSSNPLLGEVINFIKQREDDASDADVVDGEIMR